MRWLCLTVVAIVALAGCGGSGDDGEAAPATSSGAAAPGTSSGAPEAAPEKLRFSGTTLSGASFSGTSLAGKPAVFWFWAPWCPKCVSEGPAVAKAAGKHKGEVAFVGIAGLDKSKDRMRGFVERTGTGGLTQLDDRTGALYKHFKVTSQSSYVFMKADGSSERVSGPLDEDGVERRVRALVG
ncbi:redoxin domain-containing protein [Spirillospora sp. CA-294931]|uniref:redoxin domain-containing protein n=1 Tax=Spirillospora sp. CA-294931 TaxID=3240042 RepID=UPI003D94370C